MDEAAHFARFKAKHRMSVAQIDRAILTVSNGNGRKGEHLPDQLPWRLRVRETLRRTFGQGWEYIVVNKSVDSVTMPKWVASAILVAVLGFGVSSWWRSSDQRDMLIELRTELRLAKEAEKEAKAEQMRLNGDMQAWREVMNGNHKQIIGMLTQQQIDNLDHSKPGQ